MNLTNLSKSAWLDLSASWRSRGGDRLELWLPRNWPAEDSQLRRRHIAAGGAVRQGVQRGLEGLAPAEEIIVWTPAAETLFLRARLPTRSAAKIVQALPFALEEQLIDPPERLHFAFAHEADGALAVAVTRRERRSEEHTSELQSQSNLVCRLLLEKKKNARPIKSEDHTSELQSQSHLVRGLLRESQKSGRGRREITNAHLVETARHLPLTRTAPYE